VQFVAKISLQFWNQHKNTDLLISTYIDLFEEKYFLTIFSGFCKFWPPRTHFVQETAKNEGKRIWQTSL
jgi:hypothetical protein